MKKRIFSVRTLLSGVLAMLGFAGCENAWNGAEEYGSPLVDYRVIGEVTDEAGKPLSGIRVIVKDQYLYNKDGDYEHTYNHEGDTVYTELKVPFKVLKLNLEESINKESSSMIWMVKPMVASSDL